MEKLKVFAERYFNSYNNQGSRKAEIAKQIPGDKFLDIEYSYTSLNGFKTNYKKRFRYDDKGNIRHDGPIEI